MALTSEDYLLGIEKEIIKSDYYKILEINKKEVDRKNNGELLGSIEELNNKIETLQDDINLIYKNQNKQRVYILLGIFLNIVLTIVLMLIMI